jgi:hypothetical protein
MEIYFFYGAVCLLAVVLWAMVLRIDKLKTEVGLLEHKLKDKANKWELELTDRTKQLHGEKLDALQEHFGILFFEEPKRLVVKNILEK